MQEMWVQFLGSEDPLEKEIGTHSLRYSCLENSMDGGAWRATVHGVTVRHNWKLSTFITHTHTHTYVHTHIHTHAHTSLCVRVSVCLSTGLVHSLLVLMTIYWAFSSAQHCAKCKIWIILFKLPHNSEGWALLSFTDVRAIKYITHYLRSRIGWRLGQRLNWVK